MLGWCLTHPMSPVETVSPRTSPPEDLLSWPGTRNGIKRSFSAPWHSWLFN